MVARFARRARCYTLLSSALTSALFVAGPAHAQAVLPSGGTVVSGSAGIASAGTTTTISQTSQRAIVNWYSFDVGAGHGVVFAQPGAGAATLNRVTGDTTSTIAGSITANGSVYLVNPNGIAISSTGTVQTGGGFVASTLDIANGDFNAGRLAFTGTGASKSVSNAGRIDAGSGAYVALLGGAVSNSGTISVPLGKVGLGSAEQVTLDLNGDGFMQVAMPSASAGGVDMAGAITAAGGRVELKVASVRDVVRNVVNMSGNISADSAVGDGGSIVLLGGDGGTVIASGTLSARATGASGNGGFVETSGANVNFTGLTVNTSAVSGATGVWLVDPTDLTVDAAAASTISSNLATSNVTLQTTSTTASGPGNQSPGLGDITVNSAIGWTSANTLSLLAYNNIALNAAITGTAGGLTLTAGNNVANTGAISATGAVNVNVFNLTNGNWSQNSAALPAFSATDFRFSPVKATFLRVTGGTGAVATPYQVADVYGLQGMASSTLLANNFLLTGNIDASGTTAWNAGLGFVPIGTDGAGTVLGGGFTGALNGAGFAVSNLTINRPTQYYVGLLGVLSGTLSNVGVAGGTVKGAHYVGGLVGYQSGGSISKAYATGAVSGTDGYVGGLVGSQVGGSISNAYATGAVSGTNGNAGGLVGYQDAASITNAYATGAVSGNNSVGGLVGNQNSLDGISSISYSYATGAVSGTSTVGGLVGFQDNGSIISNAYATGAVSGTTNVGGLAGVNRGSISSAYATGAVSGSLNVGGLVGGQGVGSISNAYATGAVSGTTNVGGLVGSGSTVTNSYWDSYSTGRTNAYGTAVNNVNALAVTSDPAQSAAANYAYKATAYASLPAASGIGTATPAGFVFMPGNSTRPFLAFEVPTSFTVPTLAGALVLNNSNQLQLIGYDGARLAGSYSLGGSINLAETGAVVVGSPGSYAGMWAGTGFVPIGTDGAGSAPTGSGFTGSLNGGGFALNNLTISRPSANYVGLFGLTNGGTISNVGVTGGTVRGNSDVGGLVGRQSGGSISNAYATGAVSGGSSVGGLVGAQTTGASISNAYAAGAVSGTTNVGGLVGYQSNAISNAYATGAVSGTSQVGGLVGYQGIGGSISNAYATGAVSGTASYVGGLAGITYGSISSAYATGAVSGASYVGGLVGYKTAGAGSVVTNSYWDSYSTSRATAYGSAANDASALAITSDPAQSAAVNYAYKATAYANLPAASGIGTATPAGFVFMPGNSTRPFLAFEVPTSFTVPTVAGALVLTNSHQLQLIGYDATRLAGGFSLGGNINLAETGAVVVGTPGSYSGMWAGTGFVPIGTDGSGKVYNTGTSAFDTNGIAGFSGALNGGGYTLSNLTVKRSGTLNVGLFGWTTGKLKNLVMTGASVTGGNNVGALTGYLYGASSGVSGVTVASNTAGTSNVGGIVGLQYQASVTGSSSSGAVSGYSNIGGAVGFEQSSTITGTSSSATATATSAYAGGLVGYQLNGTVNSNVSASGNVSAPNAAGGLSGIAVGFANAGDASTTAVITNAAATGTVTGTSGTGGLVGFLGYNASVSQAYASGAINGATNVGGLIGYHYISSIADSYATGPVAGTTNVGGLVGIANGATLARTYATGAVTGTTNSGGLIGSAINGSTVSASVWDTQTTGQATSAGGGTGYTTAQLQDYTNYATIYVGWDFVSVWLPPNQAGQNATAAPHYPRLRARPTP